MLLPASRLAAQPSGEPEVALYVFTLHNQSASEAMSLVLPLLSSRGTVTVKPASNTLELRDTNEAITRILPVLVAFDHPPRPVDVELWLVKASGTNLPLTPATPSNVPAELLRPLRQQFRYGSYVLIGSSKVSGLEGERMTFQVGGNYQVRFRVGNMLSSQRLRLNDFEVAALLVTGEVVPLLKSQVNLFVRRPYVLVLSPGEASPTALMVVVRCQPTAAGPTPRRRP
ncbi:MAG TPA: hypothetical protein VGV61_16340 [Thermoanaerobaculia bacterium]|nr:hypothetical protein [Thermoanaerobaculia bacterium]